MRTQEEIKERAIKRSKMTFDFQVDALSSFMTEDTLEALRGSVFKDDSDFSGWTFDPYTREGVIAKMKDYMSFAWGKVEGHRGLSTSRSVDKMRAWLWLLEDHATLAFANDDCNYTQYGAPILKMICEEYGFDIPSCKYIERMADGLPCCEDCEMGCG